MSAANDLRTQAEGLRLALSCKAITVSDVVDGAISCIHPGEPLHWSLCELATGGKSLPRDPADAQLDLELLEERRFEESGVVLLRYGCRP